MPHTTLNAHAGALDTPHPDAQAHPGEHVVVTGGAGFIGSHLVDHLLSLGHRVTVLDNFSTGQRANLAQHADHPCLRVCEADISDGLALPLMSVEPEQGAPTRLVHLAAQTSVITSLARPLFDARSNHVGTLQALELARGAHLKRVVLASSAATYGDLPDDLIPTPESAPQAPLSLYGIHKLSGEHLCRAYAHTYGLSSAALRFFNVYGPRQDPQSPYSGVITIFLQRARRGQPLFVFGDGLQTRDFVYVGDVVRALTLALFSPHDGYLALNVGTGHETTILDLAHLALRLGGGEGAPVLQPPRAGEIARSCAQIGALARALGFSPQTPLAEGLERTFAWMKQL
jgi:UDP-glucose 4-epimerase